MLFRSKDSLDGYVPDESNWGNFRRYEDTTDWDEPDNVPKRNFSYANVTKANTNKGPSPPPKYGRDRFNRLPMKPPPVPNNTRPVKKLYKQSLKTTSIPLPVSATSFDQRMDRLESMMNKFVDQIQQLTTRVTTLETAKTFTSESSFVFDTQFASPTEFTNRYNKRTRFNNNPLAASTSSASSNTVTSEMLCREFPLITFSSNCQSIQSRITTGRSKHSTLGHI